MNLSGAVVNPLRSFFIPAEKMMGQVFSQGLILDTISRRGTCFNY
jgi:hypothetical protein